MTLELAALADPTRRAILQRLAAGEASVTEVAAPFAMGMPAITKHLKVLERAGLITRGKNAQWRPCKLAPEAFREVDQWLGQYRRFLDESFDRLDDYLRALQGGPPTPRPEVPQTPPFPTTGETP